MTKKIIICAAITGGNRHPAESPYLPITPEDIADEAVKAYEAGAAMVHIHARDRDGVGRDHPAYSTHDVSVFEKIIKRIKSKCNVVICLTTGGSTRIAGGKAVSLLPYEERVAVVPAFKPEVASFHVGSYSTVLAWPEPQKSFALINTMDYMEYEAKVFLENNTKPEIEIFEASWLGNVRRLIDWGFLKPPLTAPTYIQYTVGGYRIPSGPNTLVYLLGLSRDLLPEFKWFVCGTDYPDNFRMSTLAAMMGADGVRTGMEDCLYVDDGVLAKSNAELVAKTVRIVKEFGRQPATPDEAREILDLKGLDKVNF